MPREGPPLEDGRLDPARWQRLTIPSARPLTVYQNLDVPPRYRLVGDVRLAATMAETRKLLPAIDPRTTAVVECPAALPLGIQRSAGRVSVLKYSPERLELRVEATRPAFLMAAEGYAPGWQAAIDGISQSVYPANVAFMGLPVPAGGQVVTLVFAAVVSLVGWALAPRRRT